MDEIYEDLSKRFEISREEVIKKISPEFDIAQWKYHPKQDIVIHNTTLNIDEKLVNLIKLMNKYEFVTVQCCQCNWFGWASISFSGEGYLRFLNKILEKVKEKYPNQDVYETSVIKRYQYDSRDENKDRIFTYYLLFDGRDKFSSCVTVQFLQSEIPEMEAELYDLFDD